MNRYETNSKGTSPALSALINEFAKMPRSAFDETRRKSFDAAPFAIIPIETFLMFPNSDGYLKYDVQAITKNPTIRRILSSMSVELRTYKCKCSDLWEGWNNFITRGRSGKLNMSIPSLDVITKNAGNEIVLSALPYNPLHYLNIAPAIKFKTDQSFTGNSGLINLNNPDYSDTGLLGTNFDINNSLAYKEGISALPFVLYNKIVKEYQNANLLQDNPYWYPENENHDNILPYNCTHASTSSYDLPNGILGNTYNGEQITSTLPTNNKNSLPFLNRLYYRQRKGNYFNTGSPFPDLLRGDVPTLDVIGANIDFANVLMNILGGNTGSATGLVLSMSENTDYPGLFVAGNGNYNANPNTLDTYVEDPTINPNTAWTTTKRAELLNLLNSATVTGIKISMAKWRELATLSVFRERMARTDGSYNQMIQAQFKHNPKWHEHSVVYCGGSYQPIVFSEVVQQSADASTPLGTTAGRAVTSSGSNEIQIHADDYEIFMTVMTITPDDYYSQGISRMWSELTQSEQYFPILNNLNPQAVKNKELFITGNDSDDEDVFNYQELFSHFKSRQNEVSGLMALPISKVGDTGAYIFNRLFTSAPQFNNAFVTGQMTSNENLCFASTEQAQFIFSIVSQFKYVAPMPAVTQPSDMGISY